MKKRKLYDHNYRIVWVHRYIQTVMLFPTRYHVEIIHPLKELFNTVFTLKIWVAYLCMPVSLIRCKNEALIKLHLKSTIKCFKEVKVGKWPDLSHSFLPIEDCCVRINGKMVYSVVIFSHRYLDSDRINVKIIVFLTVYWSIWTSSYNTDIKVQQFF